MRGKSERWAEVTVTFPTAGMLENMIESRLGKERCTIMHTPQHTPKIHLRCAAISHLEHKYSASHFWAKDFINNFNNFWWEGATIFYCSDQGMWTTFYSNLIQVAINPKCLHYKWPCCGTQEIPQRPLEKR